SFKQRDRQIVVTDRDAILEFKFFTQSEHSLKPARTFLWITHGQTKRANVPELKWHFHNSNKSWESQNLSVKPSHDGAGLDSERIYRGHGLARHLFSRSSQR